MYFTKYFTLAIATLASAVLGNSVTFVSQDGTGRTIVFTPSAGYGPLPDRYVPGHGRVSVDFPHGWIGNWYAVCDGSARVPGMLGEVTFQGWNSLTYFDVSAIVNPGDHVGVKKIYPAGATSLVSGCDAYPCANAYNFPDDIQTKVTSEVDLICTLGGGPGRRSLPDTVERRFVLGAMDEEE